MNRMVTINKYNAPILSRRRFERLLEIENSGSDELQLDDIRITFSGPEYGWLDVKIEIGNQVFEFPISDVYQPFKELNEWFEDIMSIEHHSGIFQFDCEGTYVQFCCDYLGYWKQKKNVKEIGLFTICNDFENDTLILGVFALEDFIGAYYYSLLDYFRAHRDLFIEHWSEKDSDEVDLARLERDMTSVNIEKYLPRRQGGT